MFIQRIVDQNLVHITNKIYNETEVRTEKYNICFSLNNQKACVALWEKIQGFKHQKQSKKATFNKID